jgi:hypothetical protein
MSNSSISVDMTSAANLSLPNASLPNALIHASLPNVSLSNASLPSSLSSPAADCVACVAGTFKTLLGDEACSACPADHYCLPASVAALCHANTFRDLETSVGICIPCPADTGGPTGSEVNETASVTPALQQNREVLPTRATYAPPAPCLLQPTPLPLTHVFLAARTQAPEASRYV